MEHREGTINVVVDEITWLGELQKRVDQMELDIGARLSEHDEQLRQIFEALRQPSAPPPRAKRPVGFRFRSERRRDGSLVLVPETVEEVIAKTADLPLRRIVRPMRRALVLAGVLFAGLLVAVPALATGAGREVERELAFDLEAEGFTVEVFVSNNDGDVNATIFINRGPQVAYYSTPAKVTAERVTARFGSLGELDYHFASKRNGSVDCFGAEEGEAVFEGTFDFTGENGYVQIEAPHAEGSFQVYPEPKNCPRKRRARRAVPYHPSYSDEGATLHARAGSRAKGRIREVIAFDEGRKGPHKVAFYAALAEIREGMTVVRGVQLAAGSGAFRWNLEKGTATLRPLAPFTGWATFTRHGHDGHGTWKGSLGMPILGGESVELAGSEFRAFIHKGVPQGE